MIDLRIYPDLVRFPSGSPAEIIEESNGRLASVYCHAHALGSLKSASKNGSSLSVLGLSRFIYELIE